FNYIKTIWKLNLRTGAGAVLPHPENTIRNMPLDENKGIFNLGYYLTGISFNFAIQYKFYLTKWLFSAFEIKINPSYCRVPVVYGSADVFNITFQANFGMGFDFVKQ
ncbi:MAG: hypothetical protein HY738_03745, partial [Bacteroidia bacterium]|nr:hypothetical protein [Bacteroidia bacterium]